MILFIESVDQRTLPSSPYVTLDPIEQTNTPENPSYRLRAFTIVKNGKLALPALAGLIENLGQSSIVMNL